VASNLAQNLVSHKFKQKVLNFCESSHMGNIQNSCMLQRHLTASYSPQQNARGREEEPDSDGDGQKHDEGHVTTGLIWGGRR
jgi:aryl-alcohol dehydrogenase-like predicted oxidoreductase